jgi:chromosome partitioning protein
VQNGSITTRTPDTPPGYGLLGLFAFAAAHWALVPVEASPLGVGGLVDFLAILERAREHLNPELRLLGILPTRVGRAPHEEDVLGALKRKLAGPVLSTVIHEDPAVHEAYSYVEPVGVHAPRSRAAQEYRDLAEEVLGRMGKKGS